MTHLDSSSSPRPDRDSRPSVGDGSDASFDLPDDLPHDLPNDLEALDRSLGELLSPSGRGAADAAMIDRILAVTTPDLPARVLTFEPDPANSTPKARFRRMVAGFGAIAAAIGVATLASRMASGPVDGLPDPPGSNDGTPRLADSGPTTTPADPLEDFDLLPTRESEVMLVAVLDPTEDWFDDEAFADLDAEPVLRSRAFGLDDLEGSVFAMLGGPTS